MPIVAFSRWVYFEIKHLVHVWFTNRSHLVINLICWVSIHLAYSPFLYIPNTFAPLGASGGVTYLNSSCDQFLEFFGYSNNYLSGIFQILFNMMTFVSIMKLRKQILNQEMRAHNRQELKLFLQCAVDSLIYNLAIGFISGVYIQATTQCGYRS